MPGAINVNGRWIVLRDWRASRDARLTLTDLLNQGHLFVIAHNTNLPFKNGSVDIVYTNNVRIGGYSNLGPFPQEREIWRSLKAGGVWLRDGVKQVRS